jgi:hypothetical protein
MRVWFRAAAFLSMLAFGLLVARGAAAAGTADDACSRQLPASLVAALQAEYAGFRAPLVTDNVADDVSANRRSGGEGCIGVATGDFDGDGRKDFVVALTGADGDATIIVVAFRRGAKWLLKPLLREGGRKRLYVAAVRAGEYEHTQAYDPDVRSGDLPRLTCRHAGFMTGAVEATAVVYCLVSGKWHHTAVSD